MRVRSRREAARKQNIIFIGIIVIAVFIIIASVLFGAIKAQAAQNRISYKYYTSIQVAKGDTLWNIAADYITDDYDDMHDYIEEICSINHISDDDIHAGQYITIPYYSSDYLK